MKCDKCGYDDKGTGDTAHVCGHVNIPQQNPSNLVKMWADPRFELLVEIDKLFNGSRIWCGMDWTYHPIHPMKYSPVANKVRKALDDLCLEYGVK